MAHQDAGGMPKPVPQPRARLPGKSGQRIMARLGRICAGAVAAESACLGCLSVFLSGERSLHMSKAEHVTWLCVCVCLGDQNPCSKCKGANAGISTLNPTDGI